MRRALALLAAGLALLACAPPTAETPDRRAAAASVALPAMRAFPATRPWPATRPNAEIARDFLDLSFRLESGRSLPVFTRYEDPVRVGVRGPAPATAQADLDRLIGRLRAEAGIDIARARRDEAPNLWIEFLPRAQLQRAVPQAACFVVPRVQSFAEYRSGRARGLTDWATLERREMATALIPSDAAPQEVRDCLHEEIAQALGPLNDLYRLPDSVFNDDNFHTVLTGFDMLLLRATYAPELRSGMTEDEVAARLPALLARLNPAGQRAGAGAVAPENRAWNQAIETALGPRTPGAARQQSAARALQIARAAGWSDVRLGFSHFTLGRATLARDPETALSAFLEAASLYAAAPATEVHAAHVAMQLAAFSLIAGRPEAAVRIVDAHTRTALRAENAALLATLLLLKAEALEALDRAAEAQTVRLDSLGWARYGFGTEAEVRARLAEIGMLRPQPVAAGGGR